MVCLTVILPHVNGLMVSEQTERLVRSTCEAGDRRGWETRRRRHAEAGDRRGGQLGEDRRPARLGDTDSSATPRRLGDTDAWKPGHADSFATARSERHGDQRGAQTGRARKGEPRGAQLGKAETGHARKPETGEARKPGDQGAARAGHSRQALRQVRRSLERVTVSGPERRIGDLASTGAAKVSTPCIC
jgi:hypothetical protein